MTELNEKKEGEVTLSDKTPFFGKLRSLVGQKVQIKSKNEYCTITGELKNGMKIDNVPYFIVNVGTEAVAVFPIYAIESIRDCETDNLLIHNIIYLS